MIDALELRVPLDIALNLDFWRNRRRSRPDNSRYEYVLHHEAFRRGDEGIHARQKAPQDALVHVASRSRPGLRSLHHKIEFKRVRHYSAFDLRRKIHDYFCIEDRQIERLKVQRVDFAADVGLPIDWFREHAEVKFKQTASKFSGWREEDKRGVLTLTFGQNGDRYCIYDKAAERRDKKEQLLYPGMATQPPPLISRVERQCEGNGVPAAVAALGTLLGSAVEFDPFQRLVLHSGKSMPNMQGWNARKWLCCHGLRAVIQQEGSVASVRRKLNKMSGGKAYNYFKQYSDLFAAGPGLTSKRLREIYRTTTFRQLFPEHYLHHSSAIEKDPDQGVMIATL